MIDTKKQKKILCLGSINMDLVMSMEYLPKAGETVVTDNFNTYPGGKGGNQAVTAATLGSKVNFLGRLGEDVYSKKLIKSLEDNNVNTNNIIQEKNSTSGIAMIRVDSNGQNSISFTPGANINLDNNDLVKNQKLFKDNQILLITMEIESDVVYDAIRMAKENDMFVILDPAPVPKFIPKDIPELVDIITPNETEAFSITDIKINNEDNIKKAVNKLYNLGFSLPIITWGENGVVTLLNKQVKFIRPLNNINVVDSTAAGDVFAGALASSLANDRSIIESIKFANVAAGLSTTIEGAQSSIPSLNDIEKLIKSNY